MAGNRSREVVHEVLAGNDIVDIVSAYVELKSAGAGRLKGLCPFHNEKTPSFTVNRERQTYKCFGCGKGGDAFNFVMDHDGLSFPEALERLAHRAGVTLPAATEYEGRQDRDRRRLLDLGKFAQKVYQGLLADPLKGGQGRTYLKSRGLKPETEKRFAIGYVPDGFDHLLKAAREAGYSEAELEAAGLVRRNERGNVYDFFRNRLMIPIRDASGNVIAFGGRDLSGTAPGKYVNTPENAAYKKSQVLYGLYEAREALRQAKKAILVEGYFDAMRLADAGIGNVVASCGTALTTGQARLLHRYVREVVLVYDGDDAGIKAAMRAVAVLVPEGLSVRVMTLPDGKDPDDFIRDAGPEAFSALMESAADFVRFYINASRASLTTIEGRTEVAREVLTVLMGIDDVLRRDEYLKHTAEAIGADPWSLRRELEAMSRSKNERDEAVRTAETPAPVTYRPLTTVNDDSALLAALIAYPELREPFMAELAVIGEISPALAAVLRETKGALSAATVQRLVDEQARDIYVSACALDPMPLERARELALKRLNGLLRAYWDEQSARLFRERDAAFREKDEKKAREIIVRLRDVKMKKEALGAV